MSALDFIYASLEIQERKSPLAFVQVTVLQNRAFSQICIAKYIVQTHIPIYFYLLYFFYNHLIYIYDINEVYHFTFLTQFNDSFNLVQKKCSKFLIF